MAVTSQTAKLMLTGHVWSSAQSVAADGFESEEFTACPRAKTIAPSTIRRVGALKAGEKSSKIGTARTKKMLRQRLFSSQDSEGSEGGIFEATVEFWLSFGNIWVDFNLILRFSGNSDGSGGQGGVS